MKGITATLGNHQNLVSAIAHSEGKDHLYFKSETGVAALWLHGIPHDVAVKMAEAFNEGMKDREDG